LFLLVFLYLQALQNSPQSPQRKTRKAKIKTLSDIVCTETRYSFLFIIELCFYNYSIYFIFCSCLQTLRLFLHCRTHLQPLSIKMTTMAHDHTFYTILLTVVIFFCDLFAVLITFSFVFHFFHKFA
jgi:hypothetical protein